MSARSYPAVSWPDDAEAKAAVAAGDPCARRHLHRRLAHSVGYRISGSHVDARRGQVATWLSAIARKIALERPRLLVHDETAINR